MRAMTISSISDPATAAVARARIEAERSLVRLAGTASKLAHESPVDRTRPTGSPNAALDAESWRSVPDGGSAPGRWIVVGYDGSDAATRALARAAEAAGQRGTVVILTTEPQAYFNGPDAEPLIEPGDEPSGLLQDAQRLVVACGPVAEVGTVARKGDPAEHLLDTARAVGADLLVIGRRGKNFVARTLLGSVATRVVGQAPCDVLVVA
jgi:nucleotide-binding universal stress UspA family protein